MLSNLNAGYATNHPWVKQHDYPPTAIQPKVFISGRKGDPPRQVEIERRKRLYAEYSYDLMGLMQERGIDHSRPPKTKSYLPLEAFDDFAYESRTAEDLDAPPESISWSEANLVRSRS